MGPVMRGPVTRALACFTLAAGSVFGQSFYLPNDVVPRKETVQLTIDPARETFEGSVSIDVELRVPAAIIWLNAKNLTIGSASVVQDGMARPAKVIPGSGERVGIEGGQALAGPATIRIDYQGHLDDKALSGAYRRKFEGEWYAYTTFAPFHSRETRAQGFFKRPGAFGNRRAQRLETGEVRHHRTPAIRDGRVRRRTL